jgi:7-carboxy-7-deazaguanine synthase
VSMTYRVAEIFAGLEGEGHNPGTPTVRVRLQGCSVACKLRKVCDQQEALDPAGGSAMSLDAIVARVTGFDAGLPHPYPWVSISGGEPLEQVIEPLIWALQERGKRVRVETSGLPRRLEGPVDYIRVSPKEPKPVRTKQDWGLELSVVWTGVEDLPAWERWGQFAMRTLQPLWRPDGSSNVAEVLRICQERPLWQASIQLHKYLGIP